jgi:hypothetical protein
MTSTKVVYQPAVALLVRRPCSPLVRPFQWVAGEQAVARPPIG